VRIALPPQGMDFNDLRAQLKKSGCSVTALDKAIAEENGEHGRARPGGFDGQALFSGPARACVFDD
jgi:hypothetical protein